jgi:hypothetical protein
MKSPDGRRQVIKSNYMELRMGSPRFGSITVKGGKALTSGRTFGESMAFSRDSRYLAIEEFVGTTRDHGPHTRALVFDLDRSQECTAHDEPGGLIRELRWEADGSLSVVAWAHPAGQVEHRSIWRPDSKE